MPVRDAVHSTGRSELLSGRDVGRIPFGGLSSDLYWWVSTNLLTIDSSLGRKMKLDRSGVPGEEHLCSASRHKTSPAPACGAVRVQRQWWAASRSSKTDES